MRVIIVKIICAKEIIMAHNEQDIAGTIDFLEVVDTSGSTYILRGPNNEIVKLNPSEISEEDDLEVGEEYSFFIYPNRYAKHA